MAMKTLTNPGVYSIIMAVHMVDTIVAQTDFRTSQVSSLRWHS